VCLHGVRFVLGVVLCIDLWCVKWVFFPGLIDCSDFLGGCCYVFCSQYS